MPRYDFQSPGAAAGNAIQQFLMQRALQERQAMLDEQMRQQQLADEEDRKRRIGLQERQFTAEQERRAKLDAQAADERDAAKRQQANATGVRGMMADAMTQGPLTHDSAKTIGVMAFREGMDAPPEVTRMLEPPKRSTVRTTGPDGRPIQRAVTEEELIAGVPEYQEPDEPNAGSWASAGNGLLYNTRTGETRRIDGGSGGGAANDYATDTADRVITAIDDVLPKINNWTAGPGGAVLSRFPGTDARDVSAELQTVTGNIAFNALQQMRNASKTGGALGSVAQEELRLLQSVEGSLRQDQSPANLRAQLEKVRASMERFKAAQAMGNDAAPRRTGGGSFRVVGKRPAR